MERKSTGLRETMYSWVISEISDAERVGVPVRVDGVLYSTRDARVLHQVMEDHYYMKSYVGDEAGKICEIDFVGRMADNGNVCLCETSHTTFFGETSRPRCLSDISVCPIEGKVVY